MPCVVSITADQNLGVGSKIQRASERIISRSLAMHQHRLIQRLAPAQANGTASRSSHSTTNKSYIDQSNVRIVGHKGVAKPITAAHRYPPELSPNHLDHQQSYDQSTASSRHTPNPPQQTTPYYAGPAPAPTATVPYHSTGIPYTTSYATPTPPDHVTTTAYHPHQQYYPLTSQSADISHQPASMMDHWLHWAQTNIHSYMHQPPQAPSPAAAINSTEYLSPAPTLGMEDPGATVAPAQGRQVTVAHMAPVSTGTARDTDPRFWPPGFLAMGGAGSTAGTKY
jgi:hypothetical protein